MLVIKGIATGYGKKPVLTDVSIEVQRGESVALIGPNGAGKSTVLKAVSGLLPLWKGEIWFEGRRVDGLAAAKKVGIGLAYSPQGNRVFTGLTVRENLEIGGYHLTKTEFLAQKGRMFDLFPALKDWESKRAGTLSGGEKQMLALARALMPQPKFLMLDEPSLGLSPQLLGTVFDRIKSLNQEMGLTLLIVEQKVMDVLRITQRVYALKLSRVSYSGLSQDLAKDRTKLKELFL